MVSKAKTQKDGLILGLTEVRRNILDEAGAISVEKQGQVFLGVWSVRDLLAHLAGWDFTNLEAAKDVLTGKLPKFYAHHGRDWKTYNAMLVEKHKRENFADLLALVRASHQQLIDFLKTVSAEAFTRDTGVRAGGYKVTIARLLQAEIKDEKIHLQQIRDFRAEINNENP